MEPQTVSAQVEKGEPSSELFSETTEASDESFLSIELESLCTGTKKRFSLYLKVEPRKYVLYLSGEHPFHESHRLNLIKCKGRSKSEAGVGRKP